MDVFLKILGIAGLQDEVRRLNKTVRGFITEWRNEMATAKEQIAEVRAELEDFIADVKASFEVLNSKAGQLDEEGQAELGKLRETLSSADAEVGDADGSDVVAPEEPTEEPEPVPGGDTFR